MGFRVPSDPKCSVEWMRIADSGNGCVSHCRLLNVRHITKCTNDSKKHESMLRTFDLVCMV